MTKITYEIVQHNDGWAYKVGDVFSETFSDRETAQEAAAVAAREQRLPDDTHDIEYQDAQGRWHTESSRGDDRPETDVAG
ncbi:hypothetical protein GCM10007276_04540 [Agaricicola taiwanensis]|uniref:DUF2188 domain-containing protein n=1 Tax=Agaricicola taiwanensis TaxID=591372 RepID=A0A8J2VLX8_9RHOB|nr:hypothetical protein [Agaricicola taiwanensis]GGE30425.1 hypothetical protein GCM10007276_04540 [Agaricicola taiwanensis]